MAGHSDEGGCACVCVCVGGRDKEDLEKVKEEEQESGCSLLSVCACPCLHVCVRLCTLRSKKSIIDQLQTVHFKRHQHTQTFHIITQGKTWMSTTVCVCVCACKRACFFCCNGNYAAAGGFAEMLLLSWRDILARLCPVCDMEAFFQSYGPLCWCQISFTHMQPSAGGARVHKE